MKVKDIKPNVGDKILVRTPYKGLGDKWYEYKEGSLGFFWYREHDMYIGQNCNWEVLEYKPAMDLTKIEKPFGLLDKDTQEALKNHKGKIEIYGPYGWEVSKVPLWIKTTAYRAAPEPEVKEMTVEQISKALGYEVKIVK